MSTSGPDLAPRTQPILGAVTVPASGPAYWRAAWSARHTGTAVVSALLLLAALVSARQNALGGGLPLGLDITVLALAALVGAVTLATYVPPAGVPAREHLAGGSCGVIPLAATVVAPVMLAQAPATLLPLVALVACYGVAAGKRITDHASC
ncbi:hypothetical protein [Tessaracoccus sp. G1721]